MSKPCHGAPEHSIAKGPDLDIPRALCSCARSRTPAFISGAPGISWHSPSVSQIPLPKATACEQARSPSLTGVSWDFTAELRCQQVQNRRANASSVRISRRQYSRQAMGWGQWREPRCQACWCGLSHWAHCCCTQVARSTWATPMRSTRKILHATAGSARLPALTDVAGLRCEGLVNASPASLNGSRHCAPAA
jgi:hypothetical protein